MNYLGLATFRVFMVWCLGEEDKDLKAEKAISSTDYFSILHSNSFAPVSKKKKQFQAAHLLHSSFPQGFQCNHHSPQSQSTGTQTLLQLQDPSKTNLVLSPPNLKFTQSPEPPVQLKHLSSIWAETRMFSSCPFCPHCFFTGPTPTVLAGSCSAFASEF